jgi:DNA invertase Pin-like site-specific DNA recombinase
MIIGYARVSTDGQSLECSRRGATDVDLDTIATRGNGEP